MKMRLFIKNNIKEFTTCFKINKNYITRVIERNTKGQRRKEIEKQKKKVSIHFILV
jgi:hypothetical protein